MSPVGCAPCGDPERCWSLGWCTVDVAAAEEINRQRQPRARSCSCDDDDCGGTCAGSMPLQETYPGSGIYE